MKKFFKWIFDNILYDGCLKRELPDKYIIDHKNKMIYDITKEKKKNNE